MIVLEIKFTPQWKDFWYFAYLQGVCFFFCQKEFLNHYNYSETRAVQTLWNLVDLCHIFMSNYKLNQVSTCWSTNTLSHSQEVYSVNYLLQMYGWAGEIIQGLMLVKYYSIYITNVRVLISLRTEMFWIKNFLHFKVNKWSCILKSTSFGSFQFHKSQL